MHSYKYHHANYKLKKEDKINELLELLNASNETYIDIWMGKRGIRICDLQSNFR